MSSQSSKPSVPLSGRSHIEAARERDVSRQLADSPPPENGSGSSDASESRWSNVVAKPRANGKVKTTIHILAERQAFLRRANYITERSVSDLVDQAIELLEKELALDD